MKDHTTTYHNFSILKWFFAFIILFSFAGSSSYISSETIHTTTELLIFPEEPSFKTARYQKRPIQHIDCCFVYTKNNGLALHHTQHIETKINNPLFIISSSDRLKLYIIYATTYTDEEDSFQLS